ncbi:hypothetical protein [Pseudomonas umsongensis]
MLRIPSTSISKAMCASDARCTAVQMDKPDQQKPIETNPDELAAPDCPVQRRQRS